MLQRMLSFLNHFLVKPSNIQDLRASCPESSRCYATEVRENVPLFKEKVDILHMRGGVDEECVPECPQKNPDGESDGYEPSLAPDDGVRKPPEPDPERDVLDTVLDHSICTFRKRRMVPFAKKQNKMHFQQDGLRVKEP